MKRMILFVVATAGYFRAAIHFEQHGWELILASAWAVEGARPATPVRAGAAAP